MSESVGPPIGAVAGGRESASPQGDSMVFTRQATGLVRLLGTGDAFLYNAMITTLILGAALTYLWVPYAFPHANLIVGVIITGVLGTTMMVAYAMLGSAMPRSGGDYVFQSRLVHPALATGLIMSGYMIWLAFWESLGGWMLSTMALGPFSSALGVQHGVGWLQRFGTWCGTPWGISIVTWIGCAVALAVLVRGMRIYRKIQLLLWAAIVATFLTAWILLLAKGHGGFVSAFDAFVGKAGYYDQVIASAKAGGYSQGGFSLVDTFGVAPILWTALAWAMWSVVTAGELKNARRLKSMVASSVGALWLNVAFLVVTAALLAHTMGSTFLGSVGYLWFNDPDKLSLLPAAPYFGILTAVMTSNPVVTILLGIGFVATAFQILIGMAWGGSRLILALSMDRVLPEKLSTVNPRYHTPVRSLLLFFALSAVWTYLYNQTKISQYTLAVTLASILVYLGTMIAAIVFPYRAKAIYKASPAAAYEFLGIPLVTIMGAIALAFNGVMAAYYVTNDKLFVNDRGSMALIGGIFAGCFLYYWVRRAWLKRQGYEPDLAFAVVPPE